MQNARIPTKNRSIITLQKWLWLNVFENWLLEIRVYVFFFASFCFFFVFLNEEKPSFIEHDNIKISSRVQQWSFACVYRCCCCVHPFISIALASIAGYLCIFSKIFSMSLNNNAFMVCLANAAAAAGSAADTR